MKCWIGTEFEHNGNFGNKVLFVQSTHPYIEKVLELIKAHEITNIYFGAGELDIFVYSDLSMLPPEISVFLEVSLQHYYLVPENWTNRCKSVILRTANTDVPFLDNLYLKLRTPRCVGITPVTAMRITDISEVADGKYSSDIEVYNDDVKEDV